MTGSNIITDHYVRIAQTPAKTLERVAAFVLDVLAAGAYLFVVFFFIDLMERATLRSSEAIDILVGIPVIVYPALMETLMGGQTLGKWLMHTRAE